MHCKEILSPNAKVTTELIPETAQFIETEAPHYGLKVSMWVEGNLASHCVIPAISGDITLVEGIAESIVSQRISPAAASDFVESELSK